MNLRHPCISGVIGVVFPSSLRKLKIVRMHVGGSSLSEIVSVSPEWWTPTAKAKAVACLVLGLQFVHSQGLLHGHLTANNIFFDEDGTIQICDFCMNGLRELESNSGGTVDVGGFCGENWTPKVDVRAFAGILSEIVVGASAEQGGRGPGIPSFVSRIIEKGQSADSKAAESFTDILKVSKLNDFKIMEGVNIQEVCEVCELD
jgi:serine/threonine protein kinase